MSSRPRARPVRILAESWLALAIFALLASSPIRAAVQAQPSSVLVIEGGTLIDGNGGAPVPNALIVIRGNRFDVVSQKGRSSYPADATVIHADGKFILPGLIDAHLHYSGILGELLLAHGVTSAFDIAGLGLSQVVRRDAIARGRVAGPRLFVPVDSLLAPTDPNRVAYGPEGRRATMPLDKAVRLTNRAIANGADYINTRRGLTDQTLKAVVATAHRAGLPVIAQPIGPAIYAREAVLDGADMLEHAAGVDISVARDPSHWKGWGDSELDSLDVRPWSEMDDAKAADLIRLMVARHVHVELDMVAEGRGLQRQRPEWEAQDRELLSNPDLAYIPPGVRAKWLGNYTEFDAWPAAKRAQLKKGFANYQKFVGRFVKAGGVVMAGDDTSYGGWAVPGAGVHHELELMVDAGLTPMQAIMSATRNPAEGFRQSSKIGTVTPGKFADLVILDDSPLVDIRNSQHIASVIKDGKILVRAYHRDFVDPFNGDDLQSSQDWFAGLKRATDDGVRTLAGLTDPTWAFGQPCPGIDTLAPIKKTEGDPAFALTIKGVNFTSRSTVYWGTRSLPARLISSSELRVMIDPSLIARAGIFPIQVKNPGPVFVQPRWGNASNPKFFVVGFE